MILCPMSPTQATSTSLACNCTGHRRPSTCLTSPFAYYRDSFSFKHILYLLFLPRLYKIHHIFRSFLPFSLLEQHFILPPTNYPQDTHTHKDMPGQTALPTPHILTPLQPRKSSVTFATTPTKIPVSVTEPSLPMPKPARVKVVIAGGGIGGLALAIMFEAAKNIDYIILERSSAHKTLGSTIALNACALRMLEQLGMLPDIRKISKPIGGFDLRNDDLSPIGHIDFTFGERQYGYAGFVMSRPALFDLLRSRVPEGKILLQKQVSNVIETPSEVRVVCADGSEYSGDILVGADGAYSTVREIVYKSLSAQDKLPATDTKPMELTHVVVLGVSEPMDPVKYPRLMDHFSTFEMTLFRDKPLSVSTLT